MYIPIQIDLDDLIQEFDLDLHKFKFLLLILLIKW